MGNTQAQEEESIFTDDGTTPKIYESTVASADQWPIFYSSNYNIGFLGLEKVHPFDSGKWGKIYTFLKGKL